MPNIFTISPYMCLEDRFTLCWEYLLHHTPDLAQSVVNYIADNTGIPRSPYVECKDHPYFNKEDQPDFLIACKDYDLICEHKLESSLGHKQLQRYCELQTEKKSYVVLISNSVFHSVDNDVLNNIRYLSPKIGSYNHFLWENFYTIISDHPSHLAKEFCDYMESEGMVAWQLEDFGDIFTDVKAQEQFKEIWAPVIHYFKNLDPPAKACKRDSMDIGMHIQKPTPDIRLIYLGVNKKPLEFATGYFGRTINMRVFGNVNDSGVINKLPYVEERIETPEKSPDYHVRSAATAKPDSGGYLLLREYAVPLDHILESDLTLAKQRLAGFVKTSTEHLVDSVKSSK